jgi:hypothetical protein
MRVPRMTQLRWERELERPSARLRRIRHYHAGRAEVTRVEVPECTVTRHTRATHVRYVIRKRDAA